jgi:hypothetical protein
MNKIPSKHHKALKAKIAEIRRTGSGLIQDQEPLSSKARSDL